VPVSVCLSETRVDDVKRRLSKGKLQKFQPALKQKSGLPQAQINAP
jgi:hypothetical protein